MKKKAQTEKTSIFESFSKLAREKILKCDNIASTSKEVTGCVPQ